MIRYFFRSQTVMFAGIAVIFGLSFFRVHMRVESTLIGYEIGKLKQKEQELLEKRSFLKVSFAKLTTKKHLTLVAEKPDNITDKSDKSLAQN